MNATKAKRLRDLAIKAYWAAETPKEAKMAGILLDLFAPDVATAADGVELPAVRVPLVLSPPARYKAAA